jgi:hypothetical protein
MSEYVVDLDYSSRTGKKYQAIVMGPYKTATVHFGASGYEDYTMHHDEYRKDSYIKRHSNDHIDDIYKPGFWAMRLLWNKPTLLESAEDISEEFNVQINFLFEPNI